MFVLTETLNLRDNDLEACLVLHIQKHKCEYCQKERFGTSENGTHSNNLFANWIYAQEIHIYISEQIFLAHPYNIDPKRFRKYRIQKNL